MNTAMQELIKLFDKELKRDDLSNDEGYVTKWAIFNAKQLLEKEKWQIIDFAFDFYYDFSNKVKVPINLITENKINAEEYYNQTYNQNK